VIRVELKAGQDEAFEEAVIESGADDYAVADEFATVYTSIPHLHTVRGLLEGAYKVTSAAIEYVANSPIEAEDETMEKIAKLLDALDECDDVTNVYTNLAE